ncbi:MAG: BACON domain-containing protein [Pseudobacter sp.]|uniref:BACON domain-containing protein n=1 Tax=Pseudobacter sp. TaxID=2045420 RepID=UPI003F7D72E6
MFIACKKDKDINLAVGQPTVELATAGGKSQLSISSNGEWSLSGLPEWISASVTSGSGDASIELRVDTNATIALRTASLQVQAAGHQGVTVTVNQKGLVEWTKTVPTFGAREFVARNNELVLAGEKNNKLHFMKISKTDGSVISEHSVTTSLIAEGWIAGIDTLAGGGYVIAVNGRDPNNSSNLNTYIATLSAGFVIINQKVIDYGTGFRDYADVIATTRDGFVVSVSSSDNSSFRNKLKKYDFDLRQVGADSYVFNFINDIEVAADGSVIVAGYESGESVVYKYTNALNWVGSYSSEKDGDAQSVLATADGYLVSGVERVGSKNQSYCMLLNTDMQPVGGKKLFIEKEGLIHSASLIALQNGGYALSGSYQLNSQQSGYTVRLKSDLSIMSKKEAVFNSTMLHGVSGTVATADGGYVMVGGAEDGIKVMQVNP